jgi:ketosteroid isomerase-like protein
MRLQPRFVVGVITGVLISGCALATTNRAPAQGPSSAVDVRAIREARTAQNRAIAAGDADLAATFWTEDVTIRRALGQEVHGRAAYRQLIVPSGNRDSSLVYQREPSAVEVSNRFPLAFETGRWAGQLGGAGGPIVIGGPYSAQWVKRDGHWLIRSELFVAISCSDVGCSYRAVP